MEIFDIDGTQFQQITFTPPVQPDKDVKEVTLFCALSSPKQRVLIPQTPEQFAVSYIEMLGLKQVLYEENKGSYSAGANVRDSACYVAWAFSRAYDAEIMSDYVLELAKHLLIVSLYDREVNCRRAASAAF